MHEGWISQSCIKLHLFNTINDYDINPNVHTSKSYIFAPLCNLGVDDIKYGAIIWNISYRTYKLSYMPSRYIKGIISKVIRQGCQMLSAMVVRVIHTIFDVFTDGFGILGEESEIFISYMHCSFGHQINFSLYHFCDCSVISERLDGVRG